MIKNIETLTAKEYFQQQLKKGKIPTCPIRAGERIKFEPNGITLKKALDSLRERSENGCS